MFNAKNEFLPVAETEMAQNATWNNQLAGVILLKNLYYPRWNR